MTDFILSDLEGPWRKLSRAIYIVNDLIYIFKQLLWPQCEKGLQVAGMEARKLAGRTD